MTTLSPPVPAEEPRGGCSPDVVILDGSGADARLVGGKAAALDRLIGWGIPVPPTAVVTAAVSRVVAGDPDVAEVVSRVARGERVPADDVDAAFLAWTVPEDLLTEIHRACREISASSPL